MQNFKNLFPVKFSVNWSKNFKVCRETIQRYVVILLWCKISEERYYYALRKITNFKLLSKFVLIISVLWSFQCDLLLDRFFVFPFSFFSQKRDEQLTPTGHYVLLEPFGSRLPSMRFNKTFGDPASVHPLPTASHPCTYFHS